MSEEWRPSERCLALLTEKDHKRGDLEDQIEAFRDYHLKKGNEYADWDAAFRTWMRNSKKFAAERAAKAKSAEVMMEFGGLTIKEVRPMRTEDEE